MVLGMMVFYFLGSVFNSDSYPLAAENPILSVFEIVPGISFSWVAEPINEPSSDPKDFKLREFALSNIGSDIDRKRPDISLRERSNANMPISFSGQNPSAHHTPETPVSNSIPVNDIKASTTAPAVIRFPGATLPPSHCRYSVGLTMYGGECARLLSEESCSPGKWLVLNFQEPPYPYCAKKSCSGNMISYNGYCFNLTESNNICKIGEQLYLDYHGNAHCDCLSGVIYDSIRGECIPEHEQGSCSQEQYLEANAAGEVGCVANPCKHPKRVLNEENGLCYFKNYTGRCQAYKTETVSFHDSSKVANCDLITNRNILTVPAISSCPPGSKKFNQEMCQKVFRVNPRSASSYRVPTIYTTYTNKCQFGFNKNPDDICSKLNPLFG